METILIPPYGSHPAKKAVDFKVGEEMVMAHGNRYKIKEIINVTIAEDSDDSYLQFTVFCRLERKAKITVKPDTLIGYLPKEFKSPRKRRGQF